MSIFDEANEETIAFLEKAREHVESLTILLAIVPERDDVINPHAHALCAALGQAAAARARYIEHRDRLVGLPTSKPS